MKITELARTRTQAWEGTILREEGDTWPRVKDWRYPAVLTAIMFTWASTDGAAPHLTVRADWRRVSSSGKLSPVPLRGRDLKPVPGWVRDLALAAARESFPDFPCHPADQ